MANPEIRLPASSLAGRKHKQYLTTTGNTFPEQYSLGRTLATTASVLGLLALGGLQFVGADQDASPQTSPPTTLARELDGQPIVEAEMGAEALKNHSIYARVHFPTGGTHLSTDIVWPSEEAAPDDMYSRL